MSIKTIFWCWGLCTNWWLPISVKNLKEVITYAIDWGVMYFDTAKVYGEWWESIFSQIDTNKLIQVSTKIPWKIKPTQTLKDTMIENFYDVWYVKHALEDSMNKIWRPIDVLYLHNRSEYRTNEMVENVFLLLEMYKHDWYINHIGVSLPDNYRGDISVICKNKYITYVQINHNSINNNMNLIEILHRAGKKVNLRSIFCSWLLFKKKVVEIQDMRSQKYTLQKVYAHRENKNYTHENMIKDAFNTKGIDGVIIGMRIKSQVISNLSIINSLWKL